jgi:hypothetical protein
MTARRHLGPQEKEHAVPNLLLGQRPAHPPWPLAELVRAQRMACEGHSFEAIAQALGRPVADVRRRLDPEPAAPRAEHANVGHRHLKSRRRGDLS